MTDETTPTGDEQNDDVEAHLPRIRTGLSPVPAPDDVEAPQQGTERESGQDDGPDVEGHVSRGGVSPARLPAARRRRRAWDGADHPMGSYR